VSREGAGDKKPKQPPAAGTPIWVWVIYGFGILAATIFVFSALFTFGALYLSDQGTGFSWRASVPAITLWGVLILAAVITWVVRRKQRR
jgi:hypothetical protein